MEIRVLEYFLAVAREQSISGAAEFLHLTQPTLSRQLKDLEQDFGKQLFIRGKRKITLTDDGMLLRKRAEEIIDLVRKTENEIANSDEQLSGDIYIGAGESDGIRFLIKIAERMRKEHPNIHFHISSGDSIDVQHKLDKGLIDFGLVLGDFDSSKYNYASLPAKNIWGVLMKNDSELANKKFINPRDLIEKPFIISRQAINRKEVDNWFGKAAENLNIVATYNLIFNASIMVDEGLGYAITLDKLINTSNSSLVFVPFESSNTLGMSLVWKKHQMFSKPAELFLKEVKNNLL